MSNWNAQFQNTQRATFVLLRKRKTVRTALYPLLVKIDLVFAQMSAAFHQTSQIVLKLLFYILGLVRNGCMIFVQQ